MLLLSAAACTDSYESTPVDMFTEDYLFSKTDSSVRAGKEIEAFEDQYVRAQTGYGAATASNH